MARHGNGIGGSEASTEVTGAAVGMLRDKEIDARGSVGGGGGSGYNNGLREAGARPHTRADTAEQGVRAQRNAACPARGSRIAGARLAIAPLRRYTPGMGDRGGRTNNAQ